MLKELFEKVLKEYKFARNENFTEHSIANILRNEIPTELKRVIVNSDKYKVLGSAGQGNWTYSPWVAILDNKITDSPQKGFYAVYLFREDMKGVYLSLNQGMTEIRNQKGNNDAKNILKSQAIKYRNKLGKVSSDYLETIDLGVDKSPAAPFYEAGNIYAKYYELGDLQSEEQLLEDLNDMIDLYAKITYPTDLKIMEDPDEIKTAQEKFQDILYQKADEIISTSKITTFGKVEAYWLNELSIWYVNREIGLNRYFNGFGIQKPDDGDNIPVVCEINIPKEGTDKNVAGAFAKDLEGNVYVIHRGNFVGINKTEFLDKYPGESAQIQDGDIKTSAVVIGSLNNPKLPEHVRDFIFEIAKIKGIINVKKLKIIENPQEIRDSQNKFIDIIKNHSTKKLLGNAGFQGGQETGDVYWADDLGIWAMSRKIDGSRYWNGFGIEEPAEGKGLTITCEINFPIEGVRRNIAGAFAEDESGNIYIIHRGKLGGNFSKKDFDENYNGDWTTVQDGDRETEVVVLGRLDDAELPYNVRNFVLEIDRIKNGQKDYRIKEFIEKVLKEYLNARFDKKLGMEFARMSYNNSSFQRYLRSIANDPEIRDDSEFYDTYGNFGYSKNPAYLPYVFIFDDKKSVDGNAPYYLIYIFREDMKGVYLSLQHGHNYAREILSKKMNNGSKIEINELNEHFKIESPRIRDELSKITEIPNGLSESMYLASEKSNSGPSYEYGNIYAKYYTLENLPSEEELITDFKNLLGLYKLIDRNIIVEDKLMIEDFLEYLNKKGYLFEPELIENFLLSLKVKPFVILTGNSGTGKTKIAQLFAKYLTKSNKNEFKSIVDKKKVGRSNVSGGWALDKSKFYKFYPELEKYENTHEIIVDGIETEGKIVLSPRLFYINKSNENIKLRLDELAKKDPNKEIDIEILIPTENNSQYKIVPVGANWTENRHILGFYNVITKEYMKSDALELILEAGKPENKGKPFFLILDEMNLSHVERYFADFLSAMESGEKINLHKSNEEKNVPNYLKIPENLFVIGTVNVDETTYMFSPKVLDRANVIEFSTIPVKNYMSNGFNPETLNGDIKYIEEPLSDINIREYRIEDIIEHLGSVKTSEGILWDILSDELNKFQEVLKKSGFDFGFRVIDEILRFMYVAWIYEEKQDNWDNWERYFDAQIKQKILPKIHGSQRTLEEVIKQLFNYCCFDKNEKSPRNFGDILSINAKYPQSALKIQEMDKVLYEQRYVSFIN